jgi:plastocyanin
VATSPSVRVTDAYGVAVVGVAVTFAVDSVGAVAGASATGLQQTTDGDGIATVGGWTLGTAAGQYTLVATIPGLHASPATIHATAVAGPATAMSLASGDAQVASLDSPVADPPTVFVSDAFGNGVPGVGVTFAVTAGGGSVTGSSQITDAQGLAAAESWNLGGAAGSNTLKASSAGLNGSPVTFHATAMVFALAAVVEVHDDYFLSVRNGSGGNPTLFGSRAVDTIAVGGTVSWQWVGSGHNVTPTAASAFTASGTQSAPFSFGPVTFDRPATYGYRCTNHSRVVDFFGLIGMLGVIVVR